jgi:branched-chain amino acid transport system ATP-binding protein
MLEIKKVDVYYEDLKALRDVSLVIQDREIVTLIGSNGAGKSTTLKTVSGLLKPKTGSVSYDGVRLDNRPVHRIVELGISMVPEGRRLFPEMSIVENLEMGAFLCHARKMKDESIRLVFDIFPILKRRISQTAGTLSGGEQQMLAIGRGLMSQPKLLLLDEMSSGLAPRLVQNLFQIIKQINLARGISIFLVEQNVRMALQVAHRGYIMENGRIVDQGDVKVLSDSERVKDAYLGVGPSKSKG